MAKSRNYPIILGMKDENDLCNKYVCVGRSPKFKHSISVLIGDLKEPKKLGDSFELENIASCRTELIFCSKESLKAYIDVLQQAERKWDTLFEE